MTQETCRTCNGKAKVACPRYDCQNGKVYVIQGGEQVETKCLECSGTGYVPCPNPACTNGTVYHQ